MLGPNRQPGAGDALEHSISRHRGRCEFHSESLEDTSTDVPGKKRRNGISDLPETISEIPFELEGIGKGLQSCGFSNGNHAGLITVMMNVRVCILRKVSRESP